MNRREFLITSAAAAIGACGCKSSPTENAPIALVPAQIDAGPVADYSADGVYDRFKTQGFFIVRKGPQLLVLSAICTHRRCKLDLEQDRSFSCPCHGSCFDPTGKVTEGPATRDLPVLPSEVNSSGHLVVLGAV